jgi:chromosome partitioning protein
LSRIVAIANQKGGVAKTTTAVNLAACLAAAEQRVLLVDLDAQGSASSGVGHARGEPASGIYQALLRARPLADLVRPTALRTLKLVPSGPELVGATVELAELPGREQVLALALRELAAQFDYVFLDSPPSLDLLTLNALVAADSVLIPMQCEYYALEGLSQLVATIEQVRAQLNPRLAVSGVLLCMYDPRPTLTHEVEREVRAYFGERVYHTVIPRNVRLAEAPSHGQPILLYDIASRGCQAYLELAREFLEREQPAAQPSQVKA